MATAQSEKSDKSGKSAYIWGTGRRKSSVARVRVRPGAGSFVVNGREMKEYLPRPEWQIAATAPLIALDAKTKFDVVVNVNGGGGTGQSGAISMGLARALVTLDGTHEAAMRTHGLLTRDARMKERKKYGKAGARRSFQFSKR
jgi:small subunit ribosomal protein S9